MLGLRKRESLSVDENVIERSPHCEEGPAMKNSINVLQSGFDFQSAVTEMMEV